MMEGILKGLLLWLYGLFIDLITYCANALLGVMSTDLSFFEQSVPIVPTLYKVFVAIGWALLIGNCVFQAMKAMFAGLGFETDAPAVLLIRTFIYGVLLVFSGSICEIGLSVGKRVIDILEIPSQIELSLPDESFFSGDASWLLVIIVGFILGFQLIKLFFEIAERYVLVGVLTLLCPVGLAMGGSKSTKDICAGYIRTYASMIVLTVSNVLFLKLILSALSNMPSGNLVLPWCLLVVGIAKTARKADNLLSRIGMNPAATGDPLGHGRGLMIAAMAARTIMSTAGRSGASRGGKVSSFGAKSSSNTAYSKTGGSSANNSYSGGSQNVGSNASMSWGGGKTTNNSSSRFGSGVGNNASSSDKSYNSATGSRGVNTDRFAVQKQSAVKTGNLGSGSRDGNKKSAAKVQKGSARNTNRPAQTSKNRFGSNKGSIKHNANPMNTNKKMPRFRKSSEPVRFGKDDNRGIQNVDIPVDTEEDNG